MTAAAMTADHANASSTHGPYDYHVLFPHSGDGQSGGHPQSPAPAPVPDTDAGAPSLVEPTVDAIAERLDASLNGERPPQEPLERAGRYDWDAVAEQAERVYERAISGTW